jgi:hypothetical protein
MVRALEGVDPQEFTQPSEEQLAEGRILGQEAPSEAPPPEQPPDNGNGNGERPPDADPLPDPDPEPEPDPEPSIPDPNDPCLSDSPPDYCDDGGGDDDDPGGGGGVDCTTQPWHPRCADQFDVCSPDDPACTEVDGAAMLLVPLAFLRPLRRRLTHGAPLRRPDRSGESRLKDGRRNRRSHSG